MISKEGECTGSGKMLLILGTIEAYDFDLYELRLEYFLPTDDKMEFDILTSFGGADLLKALHPLI